MIITGPTVTYLRDNINTDEIIPARYLTTSDPDELAAHCMEDIDPSFSQKDTQGAILVSTANFGCGSSREHAPIALKSAGLSAIVAQSYARIFFRNAINIGLPIFECPAAAQINEGDMLEIDANEGVIHNTTQGEDYPITKVPEFLQALITEGGLVPWARRRLTPP